MCYDVMTVNITSAETLKLKLKAKKKNSALYAKSVSSVFTFP